MISSRRIGEFVRRLHAVVGAPGLMIGAFAVLSFIFGIYLLRGEYDRPRAVGRRAVQSVLAHWIRRPDYLGLTLVDYVARWRDTSPTQRAGALDTLRLALNQLGADLDHEAENLPLLHVIAMRLETRERVVLARWSSAARVVEGGPGIDERFDLAPTDDPSLDVDLLLTYRVVPSLDQAVDDVEISYHRLIVGLLGLSGFSLLCLVYMVLNARNLVDRVAREAAQEATLDLADRTCHELGNGVFILSNERRNLADHLDLVERFITEEPQAREAAARRSGLEPALLLRWEQALRREYAARGIDPDLELRGSAALARHVCQQIDVCADYINLTVRELDGFLKREAIPVTLATVDVASCFDEAVALLKPRIDASAAEVSRAIQPEGLLILADRRLLIHALVNLIKNAIEAAETAGMTPQIILEARANGKRVNLFVSDNGPGIPAALGRSLFEPGTTTKGPGRGRGLAIVRESIHLQEGRISVEPLESGGTRFRMELQGCSN